MVESIILWSHHVIGLDKVGDTSELYVCVVDVAGIATYLHKSYCINHNLSKAVWQAGCNAALIAKDKSCSLSGYLSSQACR